MSDEIENTTQEKEASTEAEIKIPKVNPNEAKARGKGWLPRDELEAKFKESDRDFDPDMVVSATQYLEKGEMISVINKLKKQNRDTDQRLSDNNEFWKGQLENQKTELINKKKEAIDLADNEEVAKIDGKISDIDKQSAKLDTPTQQLDPADVKAENDYFASLSNRSQKLFAKDVANIYIDQGYAGTDLVDAISVEMDKEFPPINPRREKASVTETKTRKSKSKDLSDDTLTAQDEQVFASMRRMNKSYVGKSNTELLKILKDSKL